VPRRIQRRRDVDPREGVAKYGKTTFADPVNNKSAQESGELHHQLLEHAGHHEHR